MSVKNGQTARGEGFVQTDKGNAYSLLLNPLPRVICAPDCAQQIGQQVTALGGTKAFIVTDAGVTGAGITATIEGYLKSAGVSSVRERVA